jgi:hypothetical protein
MEPKQIGKIVDAAAKDLAKKLGHNEIVIVIKSDENESFYFGTTEDMDRFKAEAILKFAVDSVNETGIHKA